MKLTCGHTFYVINTKEKIVFNIKLKKDILNRKSAYLAWDGL